MRYSRVVFAKYVPFRFYAGSRVMLQKRICKRSLALGDQLRRFRRFGFVESSVPLREEWIGSTLSLITCGEVCCRLVGFMFADIGRSGENEREEQALAVIGMSSRAEKPRRPDACHEDVALALQSRDFAHFQHGFIVEILWKRIFP